MVSAIAFSVQLRLQKASHGGHCEVNESERLCADPSLLPLSELPDNQ